MNRAELLARIRKCMALAKSANEHEAAAALAKARELMEAYGVDHADVAELDVDEANATAGCRASPPRWEQILSAAVTRAIPCEVILARQGRRFIGIAPAPEIAAYAFGVLHRQLKRARADYIATALKRCRTRKTARADSFCEGWALAVHQKIAALNPARPVDDLVRSYLARHYPNLVDVKTRPAKATGRSGESDRENGYDRGSDVNLHQGMGATPAPALLIG